MTRSGTRDRQASQRSLRLAIEGLDAAPARAARQPSRVEQQLATWRSHVTPLRLVAVLAGVTLIVLVSALAAT